MRMKSFCYNAQPRASVIYIAAESAYAECAYWPSTTRSYRPRRIPTPWPFCFLRINVDTLILSRPWECTMAAFLSFSQRCHNQVWHPHIVKANC